MSLEASAEEGEAGESYELGEGGANRMNGGKGWVDGVRLLEGNCHGKGLCLLVIMGLLWSV